MKKIAVDLDRVLFDSENLWRVYSEIYDVDVLKSDNMKDNTERAFQKRYNWTEEQAHDFYRDNCVRILERAHVMTGAEVVLKKLLEHFEIIIVTAQSDEEVIISKKKLANIGLDKIKIFNNEHTKVERLLEEKCDYIIDDNESLCRQVAKVGITGIYYKNAASRFVRESKYFKVVNGWGEIYKLLMFKDK